MYDIFSPIESFADWIVYGIFDLSSDTLIGGALHFFVYDLIKIGILLLIINYLMAVVRYYMPVESIRDVLTTRKWYGLDYLLAALFGMITPFCSCSSIPLFIGFLRAGIPLGIIFSFMITSPLVNEASLVLFVGFFGWEITTLYAVSGIFMGVVGGYFIGKLNLERFVIIDLIGGSNTDKNDTKKTEIVQREKLSKLLQIWWSEGWEITKQLMPYVMIGIGVGSFIHGYVPDDFFEVYLAGVSQLWAVPAAVIAAIPLYSNAVGVIPIMQALVEKGIPLGTALAFMMSVVGMSLPELLILRKIVKKQILIAYYSVVAVGIILIGYLFNYLFYVG